MIFPSVIMFEIFLLCLLMSLDFIKCEQNGPDPWNYHNNIDKTSTEIGEYDIPSDLKIISSKHLTREQSTSGEWFYKRILAVLLKGGKVKKSDNGYMDIILQMHLPVEQWDKLNEFLRSNTPFSEDMYRRSIGYVQEAITKPSVTETLVIAWSDYVQFYLVQYKTYITWLLGCTAAILLSIYAWKNMSHKHAYILLFIVVYLYEAFVSYKEAEQHEYERFISSVNNCKWYFWSSACEIPPPDPLIFIKHMHPLKIGMKIFTMLISEPMISISSTVSVMLHEVTDGLWFPLNKIVFIILVVTLNCILIIFLITILFNYILNIPFKLSLLAGLINVGMKQRERSFTNNLHNNATSIDQGDRLSGANLNKLLNVCALAQQQSILNNREMLNHNNVTSLKKSASTGRLCEMVHDRQAILPRSKINNNRKESKHHFEMASGDCLKR